MKAAERKALGLKPETEEQFLQQVLTLAKWLGWRSAHFRPARTKDGGWRTAVAGDGKGWPDLVLVKGGRIIFAELKTDTGTFTPEQEAWLKALEGCCQEVYRWRPHQWQWIENVLRGLGV